MKVGDLIRTTIFTINNKKYDLQMIIYYHIEGDLLHIVNRDGSRETIKIEGDLISTLNQCAATAAEMEEYTEAMQHG